ncbi:unnamed protein product [Allacma fusca]|uniref:DUF4789 domain-containing protein n=1 Tax=Allacma fusca TaxID=39272 RepID=A0A8J2PZJ4_9HEXA|nr:unnamed protein product [Allacma fusca]
MVSILILTAFAEGEKAWGAQTSKLCRQYGNEPGVYRFDNQTRSCYQVGRKGPCGELMVFYADPNSPDYGQCDCDISKRCNRHMLYWPSTNRCYFTYEQGPCSPQNWLVFGRNLKPACEPDLCTAVQTEFDDELGDQSFWIYHKNECVLTGTEGHCQLPNEKLIVNGFSRQVAPFCSAITYVCKIPEVPSLVCAPGQKWHSLEGCSLWNPNAIQHSPHIHGHHGGHHGHKHNHNGRSWDQNGEKNAPAIPTPPTTSSTPRYPGIPTSTPRTLPDNRRPDPIYNGAHRGQLHNHRHN